MREKDKNLAEQKIQQYHLVRERGAVLRRERTPNSLPQPDCVPLRRSQQLSRLRQVARASCSTLHSQRKAEMVQ